MIQLQEDERLLEAENVQALSSNKRHAVVVRLGEKRILRGTVKQLRAQMVTLAAESKKRSREDDKTRKGKKARKADAKEAKKVRVVEA